MMATTNSAGNGRRAHLETTAIAEAPRSLSLRGTRGRAGERGTFHRIGAANWNPLSFTLSPLLRRGERESTAAWWLCQDALRLGIPRRSVRLAPQLSGRFRQRRAARLNLPNRLNDVIHVPAVGQEQILGQTDRRRPDLPVALQF